jgi:hypothetical protein
MPMSTLATMIIIQVVIKVIYEIIILPFTVFVTKKIQVYEDKYRLN